MTYTQAEKKIMNDMQQGKYVSVTDFDNQKEQLMQSADYHIRKKKKKAISIRLFEEDIAAFKKRSLQEGIPYQTLISSEIHSLAQKIAA